MKKSLLIIVLLIFVSIITFQYRSNLELQKAIREKLSDPVTGEQSKLEPTLQPKIVATPAAQDKNPINTKTLDRIWDEVNKPSIKNNGNSNAAFYNYQNASDLPSHGLYCIPVKKFNCSVDGCKEMEPTVFVLLGYKALEDTIFMARCDDKPCDIYDVNILQPGAFTTYETKEPHGILFRTSSLDQSYVEVATLGTEAFISNGYCYPK